MKVLRGLLLLSALVVLAFSAHSVFADFGQYPGGYGNMSGVAKIGVGAASVSPTWPLEVGGTWTAASGVADGISVYPTLKAAANSDVLTGVTINPTFTPGSFTSVSQVGLAVMAGKTGLGVATPSEVLEVNGGVRLNTATVQPTCAAGIRGDLWIVQGGSGVTDTVYACLKAVAGTFSWVSITTGG